MRIKSLLLALLAFAVPFLTMCSDVHFAFSVPIGAGACLVGALCVLDLLGTFDDATSAPAVPALSLVPRSVELASSVAVFVAAVRLSVAGRLPFPELSSALLVTASALWMIVATFRLLTSLGALDAARPLGKRWGFWLLSLHCVLALPLLGAYSLSDPWETHYGEVAREMLARDDWISTWWAQENWFWSKPVLDFWLQALSFSTFGVRFGPDQMLAAAALGLDPRPEWAARLPVVALSIAASYVLYRAAAQRFGARAGFLGGLLLATLPYWYLIARQSMTDMPYVAPLTAAVAFVLLGLGTEPEARVTSHPVRIGRRVFAFSGFHLLFGLVLLTSVPQILYLLSRQLTLQLAAPPYGFRLHADEIPFGSAGNCGLPGNEACRMVAPVDEVLQPALAALIWALALGTLLWTNRAERRTQRLLFLAAWYATALAALAKGAPGLVLPVVVACATVAVARRFRDFTRLELVGLALLVACVCLPWYVQMYARHGAPFTDRLLFHDMYKRAFVHVHDTNTGDDVSFRYYLWQLGYGLFPWTGLAALGFLMSRTFGDEAKHPRAEAAAALALWAVLGFALFSASLTKFHHYALPLAPPLAVLGGVALDRFFAAGVLPRGFRLVEGLALLGASALLLIYGAFRLTPGALSGRVPPPPSSPWLAAAALAGAAALFGLSVFRVRRGAVTPNDASAPNDALTPSGDRAYETALTPFFALSSALIVALVGRDLFAADDPDGPARLLELASYNYQRPWPATLDFRGVLTGIALAATVASAALSFRPVRAQAAVLLCAVGIWASVWTIDVYVVRVAPHWGQRETIIEYYRKRRGPEEPLIAFQMNWKGENFYTGNRIPAFVSTGAKFKAWLDAERERGTRVIFVTTEHSREAGLKTELGEITSFERLTGKALNNKFFLARVEL